LFQTTLNREFSFSGVGLHSGRDISVSVFPAEENTGIVFARTDVKNSPFVRTTAFNVTSTQLATTVSCGDFPISTIEHLLSALYGLGVDNAKIGVEGAEIPIMDGSAAPLAEMIVSAGISSQRAKRKYLKVLRGISSEDEDKSVSASPGDRLKIFFEIEYASDAISRQAKEFDLTPASYLENISIARTFGFRKEVEMLWQMGLAKGGSMQNAVVVDDVGGVLNPEGLRVSDEFVSHKILDLIGDLALVGYRLIGEIRAVKSGHGLNNRFARKLLESLNYYSIEELSEGGYGHLNTTL
jgi:UDP-3-O-[3-hydroxymyristoyl] N-acetylglucosamine deacetylase